VKRVLSCEYLFIESVGVFVFEREVSIEHGEENDSARPDIYLDTLVSLALDHFGSSIARRTTWCFEQFTLFISVTKPKIDDLQRVVITKKDIFRF
jgi:hypothetical protein